MFACGKKLKGTPWFHGHQRTAWYRCLRPCARNVALTTSLAWASSTSCMVVMFSFSPMIPERTRRSSCKKDAQTSFKLSKTICQFLVHRVLLLNTRFTSPHHQFLKPVQGMAEIDLRCAFLLASPACGRPRPAAGQGAHKASAHRCPPHSCRTRTVDHILMDIPRWA